MEVANSLDGHPLALELAAKSMSQETTHWFRIVSELQDGLPTNTREEKLNVCFDLRVRLLHNEHKELYFMLGIFAEGVWVPDLLVARLWRHKVPAVDARFPGKQIGAT
jgi:hypothetical protein